MVGKWRFRNINGTLQTDKRWKWVIEPYSPRNGDQERYGRPGGTATGDGQIGPRGISFNFENIEGEDPAYLNYIRQIATFFRKQNGPFYAEDITNDIRCKVVLNSLSDDPFGPGSERRFGRNAMRLTNLDGLFEDLTETSIAIPGLVDQSTFEIVNDIDDPDPQLKAVHETWPIFEVTCDDQTPEFTIINETNGTLITLTTNAFDETTTFYINGVDGTIYLDDQELSSAIVDGTGIIRLEPGTNEFKVENPYPTTLGITVKYRKRYAFA